MSQFNLSSFINRSSLYIALLAAWIAMLGSLYFSEVAGYLPCELCWYQRILMYPLAAILAVGLLRQDAGLPYYVLPLSIIGQGFSTYHYLLEKTTIFGAPTACRSGIPCTVAWINWFGFITIPFLAMIGFFIITIMVLIALTAGEPDETVDRPTPWWSVGGVIAAVVVAFAILTALNSRPEATLALTEVPSTEQSTAVSPASSFAQTTDPSEGAEIYKVSCAACHGPDARGLPNLGNTLVESELINTASDAEILAQIRAGVDLNNPINTTGLVMPPSGGRPDLSDPQLLAVVNWIRSLQ